MPKIVISYRRLDSEAFSGRIYDRLVQHYGKNAVFIDIDKIPYGDDFGAFIGEQLKEADLLLVVIGPRWLEVGHDGKSRILNEGDWVRAEIETALRLKVRVIPLLINGVKMPGAEELPESLKELPKINALPVDGGADFHPHMTRLINAIDRFLNERGHKPVRTENRPGFWTRQKRFVAAFAACLLLGLLGVIGLVNDNVRSQLGILNGESQQPSDEKAILLDIVLASLGRPMNLQRLPSTGRPGTDQAYQQGILSPLPQQVVDYYLRKGVPPQLWFDLVISEIEMIVTDGPGCDRFTFKNDVSSELKFGQFQALSDYLLSSGFTTERTFQNVPVGPAIIAPRPEKLNSEDAAKLIDAYSKAAAAGLDITRNNLDEDVSSLNVRKRSTYYRFCFALIGSQRPVWLGITPDAYCGFSAVRRPSDAARARRDTGDHCPPVSGAQGSGSGGDSQFHGIRLAAVLLDRIRHLQEIERAKGSASQEEYFPIERFRARHVTFRFQTRSVEGMLGYLGEITRQHLRPEAGRPRVIQVKTGLRYGRLPSAECDSFENGGKVQRKVDLVSMVGGADLDNVPDVDPPDSQQKADTADSQVGSDKQDDQQVADVPKDKQIEGAENRPYRCENLFVLQTGSARDSVFSVRHEDTVYHIPSDPAQAGRTLQVVDLIKSLLILHTPPK